jgi:hypothetical protein
MSAKTVRIIVQGGQATVDWGGFQGTPGCFQAGADLIRRLAALGVEVQDVSITPKTEGPQAEALAETVAAEVGAAAA